MTPKKARKKWVAALRSGEFKQCKNALTHYQIGSDNYSYCCLGVACEVFGIPKKKEADGEIWFTGKHPHRIDLPVEIKDLLGLRTNQGHFHGTVYIDDIPRSGCLTGLNDSDISFEKIADVIEQEPEGLLA